MFFLSMISCSGDELSGNVESGEILLQETTRDVHSLPVLCFDSFSDFDEMLRLVIEQDEDYNKYEIINTISNDFHSLIKVYQEAMNEAADLDQSRNAYLNYKNKYSAFLYFPMYGEDCGAYLPVSDKNIAYLLNPNGEVEIAGKRICLNNVGTYSDLQKLGWALYDYSETRGWSTPSYIQHVNQAFANESKNVGQEFDSGWYETSDRKLRVKLGRKIENPNSPVMKLHLEISFRKKTWLGWVNYSSKTETKGDFSGGYVGSIDYTKEADSSHDWYAIIPANYIGTYLDWLGNPHWTNPSIFATLKITFRGIGVLEPLSCSIGNLDATMPNPTPVYPY